MTTFDDTHDTYTHISDTTHHNDEQLVIVLDQNGVIQACSDNCQSVVGYEREELLSRHISALVLQFAAVPLFVDGQLNPLVSFLGHCDMPFLVRHRQGNTFRSKLSFVVLHQVSHPALRLLIGPRVDTGQ